MSKAFDFFITPEEFADAVRPEMQEGASLWRLPDANAPGKPVLASTVALRPTSVVWLGKLSQHESWTAREAAFVGGAVAFVMPVVEEAEKSVFLSEMFTPADKGTSSDLLFRRVKRRLEKILVGGTKPVDVLTGTGRGKGPKASQGVLDLFACGFRLRQFQAKNVMFEPSSSQELA